MNDVQIAQVDERDNGWAQRQAGATLTYAVTLVYNDGAHEQINPGYGRGSVWLVGTDGNGPATDHHESEMQTRMPARHRVPVTVSFTNQMPPDVLDSHNDGTTTRRGRQARTAA